MPKIWPITSQGFPGLFEVLGIQAVPAGPQWWLSDTIQPVSIVDSRITLLATQNPGAETFATAGDQTNPAAATLLADTAALVAGLFQFKLWLSVREVAAANAVALEHRNAANAANIWRMRLETTALMDRAMFELTWTEDMVLNERVRVVTVGGSSVGSVYQAILWRRFIT